MKTNFLLAAALALSASSTFAQNNSNDPAKQDPFNMQGSAPDDWTTAKGHEKGFLTMEDAQPNSWIAQNFKSCDQDHDGKVTQDEYAKCQKQKTR